MIIARLLLGLVAVAVGQPRDKEESCQEGGSLFLQEFTQVIPTAFRLCCACFGGRGYLHEPRCSAKDFAFRASAF